MAYRRPYGAKCVERFARRLDAKGLGLEKKKGVKECLKVDYDSVLSFTLATAASLQ